MKANRVHRFGSPDVIVFEDAPIPMPGGGEVLVRVSAAGVGPWDALVRSGRSGLPQPLPLTLGAEISGTIEAVGSEVSELEVGDDAFGSTNANFTGAYAEFALASAAKLAKKPQSLSWVVAAAVPVVAVTALQMLERARLQRGQRVLVLGAAGSVGTFAVQLARRAGLHVSGTIASGDVDYVRTLGADDVIDVRSAGFAGGALPFDAVLDLVGGEAQTQAFAALKPGGALISVVSQPDAVEARRRGVRTDFFFVDVNTTDLTTLAQMLDAGDVQTRVGTVLSLAEAREAHEMLEGRRTRDRGKIVLRVAGNLRP